MTYSIPLEPVSNQQETEKEEEEEQVEEQDDHFINKDTSRNQLLLSSSSSSSFKYKYQKPTHSLRTALLTAVSLLTLSYLILLLVTKGTRYDHDLQINVILMISDGFGPASETFARNFVNHIQDSQLDHPPSWLSRWSFPQTSYQSSPTSQKYSFTTLPLDSILVGTSRTRSSNSLITDSAAGATAFSCGIKTYNGAISVEPLEQKPCGTILEAAKHRGYLTGLVATSRITHATPACFYSHVIDRAMENEIAHFLTGEGPLGPTVDLAFGGGRRNFLPNSSSNSIRQDDLDLLRDAQKKFKFTILNSTEEFEKSWNFKQDGLQNSKIQLPVIGLFNDNHLNYEIDRISLEGTPAREPSLRNMSLAALHTLSRQAKKKSAHGFFLMIEGSRIDMAAHSNDPVSHLYDILAYQETVRTVKTWVDEANKAGWPTLMISVSDHETGGLSTGRQLTKDYPVYAWYPEVLLNATHSASWLAKNITETLKLSTSSIQTNSSLFKQFLVDKIFDIGLGITDPSNDEIQSLLNLTSNSRHGLDNELKIDYFLADMVSRRAQVGWSSHGHSAVDVNLYSYPPDLTQGLMGNIENTQIADFIVKVMDIDLNVVTRDLNRLAKSWHITDDRFHLKPNFQNVKLDHYHHEF